MFVINIHTSRDINIKYLCPCTKGIFGWKHFLYNQWQVKTEVCDGA